MPVDERLPRSDDRCSPIDDRFLLIDERRVGIDDCFLPVVERLVAIDHRFLPIVQCALLVDDLLPVVEARPVPAPGRLVVIAAAAVRVYRCQQCCAHKKAASLRLPEHAD